MARKNSRIPGGGGSSTRQPFSASTAGIKSGKSKSRSTSSAAISRSMGGRNRSLNDGIMPEKDDISNAYTFDEALPSRHRTSKAQNELSRDEAALARELDRRPKKLVKSTQGKGKKRGDDSEEDDEGDEDMEERISKLAMMIAGEGPGVIASDSEESEVDSDEAWEEGGTDDDRWGDVFRDLSKGKKGKGKGKAKEVVLKPTKPLTSLNVNLDESEDEVQPGPSKSAASGKNVKSIKKASKVAFADEEEKGDDDEDEEDEDLDEDEDMLENDSEEDEFAIGRKGVAAEDGSDDVDEEGDELLGEDSEEDEFAIERINPKGNTKRAIENDDEQDEEEDEEEEEEDLDLDPSLPSDLSDSDEEEEDPDLDSFVEQLASIDQGKKRKNGQPMDTGARSEKKRRVLPVVQGPEIQDGDVPLRNTEKIDIATLLASTPSLSSASALLPSKYKDPSGTNTSILKSGVLPAPLPTVVQDRLDREAAYLKTKEEGLKWEGVMSRIKQAEHLSFPLQANDRGGVKTTGELISNFQPNSKNSLESAVDKLLKSANLTDQTLSSTEDAALQGQELSIEEIAERRKALRYQRELMFRAEARAKRVAKIKSKTFRKLARKRAEKDQIGLEDLERLDPDEAESSREKMERQRALERATLKHGAQSRYGLQSKDNAGFGLEDRRRAREEMLDRKEKLKRKIMGLGDENDSDDHSDDEDEHGGDDESDDEVIKAKAFDQLNKLDKGVATNGDAVAGGKKGGLAGMKFMQRAEENKMKNVKEMEAALRDDIRLFGNDKSGSEDEGEDSEEEGKATMLKIGEGRMVFSGPVPTNGNASTIPQASAQVENPPRQAASRRFRSPSPEEPASNPWLAATTSSAGPSRKKNTITQSAESKSTKITQSALKKDTAKQQALEDERIEIDVSGKQPKSSSKKGTEHGGVESDSEDEGDELMPIHGNKAFKQRELVAEAFAGDNVVEDFAAEKSQQITSDAPQIQDTSLPGWGSWGGKGAKKKPTNPKFLVATAGIIPEGRKDFGQSNVIINEKKDIKANKFLVKDLPYPYTSVAQYEASFRAPVGKEWNSRGMYQKETMPRVTKKRGAIIEPVRRLF